jgi:hypothetical protein
MLLSDIAARKIKHPILAWAIVCIAAYPFFLSSRAWTAGFAFEKFEGFLGLGGFREAEATKAFLDLFPLETPIQKIEQYFDFIGGHCDSLRDHPAQMFCGYASQISACPCSCDDLGGRYRLRRENGYVDTREDNRRNRGALIGAR